MTFRGLKIRWVNLRVNKHLAGTKEKHFEKKRRLLNSIGHDIGGDKNSRSRLLYGKACSGKKLLDRQKPYR